MYKFFRGPSEMCRDKTGVFTVYFQLKLRIGSADSSPFYGLCLPFCSPSQRRSVICLPVSVPVSLPLSLISGTGKCKVFGQRSESRISGGVDGDEAGRILSAGSR